MKNLVEMLRSCVVLMILSIACYSDLPEKLVVGLAVGGMIGLCIAQSVSMCLNKDEEERLQNIEKKLNISNDDD